MGKLQDWVGLEGTRDRVDGRSDTVSATSHFPSTRSTAVSELRPLCGRACARFRLTFEDQFSEMRFHSALGGPLPQATMKSGRPLIADGSTTPRVCLLLF